MKHEQTIYPLITSALGVRQHFPSLSTSCTMEVRDAIDVRTGCRWSVCGKGRTTRGCSKITPQTVDIMGATPSTKDTDRVQCFLPNQEALGPIV